MSGEIFLKDNESLFLSEALDGVRRIVDSKNGKALIRTMRLKLKGISGTNDAATINQQEYFMILKALTFYVVGANRKCILSGLCEPYEPVFMIIAQLEQVDLDKTVTMTNSLRALKDLIMKNEFYKAFFI